MRKELKEIETPLGVVYLDYSHKYPRVLCMLLDSDKKFIAHILDENIIEEIKTIQSIDELADIGVCENLCFGRTKFETAEYCVEFIKENEDDDIIISKREIESYEKYVNRIGDDYFIPDFTEL